MGSKNPLKSELKKFRIAGGFTEDIYVELKRRPELVRELAREILAALSPSRCTKAYAGPLESPSTAPTVADATRHSARRSSTLGATAASFADTRYNSTAPTSASKPPTSVGAKRGLRTEPSSSALRNNCSFAPNILGTARNASFGLFV